MNQYVVLKYGNIYDYFRSRDDAEAAAIRLMQRYGWIMDVCEIVYLSTYKPDTCETKEV